MNDTNHHNLAQWIKEGCPVYSIRSRKELEIVNSIISEAHDALNRGETEGIDTAALNELQSAADYAGDRHWTFQWKIIAGAIISVILLSWWSGSKKEDAAEQQKVVDRIEKWQKTDTVIKIEAFKDRVGSNTVQEYEKRLNRASDYKYYQLLCIGTQYHGVASYIEGEVARHPNIADPEKKESHAKYIEKLKKEQPAREKELKEKYDNLNKMTFKEIHGMALEEVRGTLEDKESSASTARFWFWFLIVCTPLYIFACRPYGYSLNKHAVEAETLNGIHKFAMWASGGLVGAAAALHYTTIITKWSDGRVEKSDDGMGPVIMVTKILLICAAVLVFCFVSCFIMAYATIVGLIRNYDWKAIFAKLNNKKVKTA